MFYSKLLAIHVTSQAFGENQLKVFQICVTGSVWGSKLGSKFSLGGHCVSALRLALSGEFSSS